MNVYGIILIIGLGCLSILIRAVWQQRQAMDEQLQFLRLKDGFKATYYGFLDAEDRDIWQEMLLEHLTFLRRQGWSDAVITGAYLKELTVPDERDTHVSYLKERLAQSQVFGSDLFQNMWRIGSQETRIKELQQLLKAGMRLIEMPDDLSGTMEETQSLINRIATDLEPADLFWKTFSQTVQRAFPGQTLAGDGKLNRQIHQFRYVISSQQAQWVRRHYRKERMTDAQALAAYIRHMDGHNIFLEELGIDNYNYYYEYNLTESARLHNKIALEKDDSGNIVAIYPDGQPVINFKILMHFHTEFILDELGNFLNEVDAEQITENGVLNGASFNYASRNDARHRALDIAPVGPHDPKFRKRLARQKGLRFFSPNRLRKGGPNRSDLDWECSYFNPSGYFAQNGQSAAQRVMTAVQEFERAVQQDTENESVTSKSKDG